MTTANTDLMLTPRGATSVLMRRATLSSSPAAIMLTNNELPPAEKNGKVRPVTGMIPVTPPRLTMACTPNQAAIPPASSIPNRSVVGEGGLDAESDEHHEPADDRDRARRDRVRRR